MECDRKRSMIKKARSHGPHHRHGVQILSFYVVVVTDYGGIIVLK